MRHHFLLAAIVLAAMTPVERVAAELITNPSFEDNNGDENFGAGWGAFGSVGFNDFFNGNGNGHGSFFLDATGNSGGIFQLGITGSFGNLYTFTLEDVLIESNAAADSFSFGLEFYQGDDATQISNSLVSLPLTPTGGGLRFTHTAAAPIGTQFVRPIISFSGASGAELSNENVFVFNTSLTATAVPEPSSLVILVTASAVGLVAQRRSRHRGLHRQVAALDQ